MAWAVITGGSGGLGEAIAGALAAKGFDVMLVARGEVALEAVAARIGERYKVRTAVCAADLSTPDGLARVERTIEGLDDVKVLVNNAGFGNFGRMWEIDPEIEAESVRLNIGATLRLTRFVLPRMIAAGKGTVLNVASTAGFQPVPYFATYGGTKAFVVSFSEAVTAELAGNRISGVRVVALCPGPMATGFQSRAGMGGHGYGMVPFETVADVAAAAARAVEGGAGAMLTGWAGKLMVFLNRFTPRVVMLWSAERMFRPRRHKDKPLVTR